MVVLVGLDQFDAVSFCVATRRGTVMDVHISGNSRKWSNVVCWCARMPFTAAYYRGTSGSRVSISSGIVRI